MEIPIKMDDLGVPLFLETPIQLQLHRSIFWLAGAKEKEQTKDRLDWILKNTFLGNQL